MRKRQEVAAPEAPVVQSPGDAPILDKMIQRKSAFEAGAEAQRAKNFDPVAVKPRVFRLAPAAYAQYQDWAAAQDAAHVGISQKVIDKDGTTAPYEAGDTNLHRTFAGLPVVEEIDLPGESVIVE